MNRRPNPDGWTQPRAPYNPYDPADQRPAGGYPSEFKTPGRPRDWTQIPKDATSYREVQESMRRLNYTPRPRSTMYPGQLMVLRRRGDTKFVTGVRGAGRLVTFAIVVYGVFFYRWNDGYENIFSAPYQWQLGIRQKLFGNLSPEQMQDLQGRQRGMVKKTRDPSLPAPGDMQDASGETVALERPEMSHVVRAERLRQEREEALLRAVDIAERKLKETPSTAPSVPPKKGWW